MMATKLSSLPVRKPGDKAHGAKAAFTTHRAVHRESFLRAAPTACLGAASSAQVPGPLDCTAASMSSRPIAIMGQVLRYLLQMPSAGQRRGAAPAELRQLLPHLQFGRNHARG